MTFREERKYPLSTISVVSLNKHDLLCNLMALFYSAESKNATQSRISLLVRMCHPHTATCGDIETFEFTTFTKNRNEANIIREYVDVIRGRNSNSNFELIQ